jgi:REP element-mobilizing transposase RayT
VKESFNINAKGLKIAQFYVFACWNALPLTGGTMDSLAQKFQFKVKIPFALGAEAGAGVQVSVLTICIFSIAGEVRERQSFPMPRQLRLEYRGAIYHVINRGDRREDIFRDDEDRQCFLSTLGEACQKTRWEVLAYCLMRNHFHLVTETPDANLVAGMKWLLGVYTKRFNIRHKGCGHLFAGRYKALIVDGGGSGYLRTVCDYVHLNPVRAKWLAPEAPLESFLWSSYAEYLKAPRERPPWLRVERLLGEKGIPKDSAAGRRELARQMERRREQEESTDYREVRRGWCLGSEGFRRDLLAAAADRAGSNQYGSDRFESSEERARRMIARELKRLGWAEGELTRRRKGDRHKVALARRLRAETTMSLAWIAERLRMGSWSYVSNLLRTTKTANSED